MVSIKDVAKLAGCSPTLVSRVLNQQSGVSEKMRAQIHAAIDQLGYTPNAAARSLVLKKSNTIGVVLDSLYDPFYFELIKGLEDQFEKYDYQVFFCSGKNNLQKKNKQIAAFIQQRTDGIIIYGSALEDAKVIDQLIHAEIPFALIENDIGELAANNVTLDNEYGSMLAIDYLAEIGCKKICYVTGSETVQASLRRQAGFTKAMQKHGFTLDVHSVIPSNWTSEDGYQSIKQFLTNQHPIPDAFYFSSDQTAFGGIRALQEAGIRIPEDVKVVGFDDDTPHLEIDFTCMKLTTIQQPLYEMGQRAVDLLITDIENGKKEKGKCQLLPKLIVREST